MREVIYRIDYIAECWTDKFTTSDIGDAALAMTLVNMPELSTYDANSGKSLDPPDPLTIALAEAFDGLRNG